MRSLPLILAFLLAAVPCRARVIRVPVDLSNIQAAIDAASDGDTILVADGMYSGTGNKEIDFRGKAITVRSENGPDNCIVDCAGWGRAFYFHSNEIADSVLDGFTITRGNGIVCVHSSPTISDCVIKNNSGGIYATYSSARITNCVITGNTGSGGIHSHSFSNPSIENCAIVGNSTNTLGGGIYLGSTTSFRIANCTITGNYAKRGGGGVVFNSAGTIVNSIIWGNSNPQLTNEVPGTPVAINVTYCAVEGGCPGTGNIADDPLLAQDGYHVEFGSPCINVGDPAGGYIEETDIDGEDRVAGGRVDIGADEFYPDAPAIKLSHTQFNFIYVVGDSPPEPKAFFIENIGIGKLDWGITSNCGWLVVDPCEGSCTEERNEVRLKTDANNLEVGNYNCVLVVSSPNAVNSPKYIAVSLDVGTPVIAIRPTEFDFACPLDGPNAQPQVMTVWNDSIGSLNWQISEDCEWLEVWPTSGESAWQTQSVTLTVDVMGIQAGEHACILEIRDSNATNSPQSVAVNLSVKPPVIGVTPTELEFVCPLHGPHPEAQTLSVWNDEIGRLNWQIVEDCNWLSVSPASGQSGGEVSEVVLNVDGVGLKSGEYTCVLEVSDPNAVNTPQYVTANLAVEPPIIGLSPNDVNFVWSVGTADSEPQYISVWNDNIGRLNWEIIEDCNWLDVSPTEGESPGDVNEVILSVNTTGLAPGTYACNLSISDPDAVNSPQTVAVVLDVLGEIIFVPSQFSTIQDGIDHVQSGGTVIVADGTYIGTGNRDIDFRGKAITVRSENGPENCIVDCNDSGRGFVFISGEYGNSVVDGFTITKGYAPGSYPDDGGGGIYCNDSSPTITNCIITGNSADGRGGGICCTEVRPVITNCTITGNSAYAGGGIARCGGAITNSVIGGNSATDAGGATWHCPGPITNCVISNNSADGRGGGGLYTPLLAVNCTIVGNSAVNGWGGGIHGSLGAQVEVKNCIVWQNVDREGAGESSQIFSPSPWPVAANYCSVQGWTGSFGGLGNIDDDPMLTPDGHLQNGSPCIDAGPPGARAQPNRTDIDGQRRIMGRTIDMGADEYFIAMLVVTRPKQGEVCVAGSQHEITWDSDIYEGTVDILFSTDGGGNAQVIENRIPNSGSYRWQLPDSLDSNRCVISVVPSVPDANVVCFDSGLFTIHPDSPGPAVVSKWKSLGGDFDRAGLSENYGPELGCVKWQFETGGVIPSSVTIGFDGRVHVACEDGTLYTLDADGTLLWSYDANSPLISSPSIGADGTVYVGSENGRLYAIAMDGHLRWTHTTEGFVYSSPAVSVEGNIYAGSVDGVLYALGQDGSELWVFKPDGVGAAVEGSIFASPAVGPDGTVYVAGLYDPNLYALDPSDGSVKWTCNFEYSVSDGYATWTEFGWPFASPVIAPDGTIYVTLLYDPNLYAIEPNTGEILWSTDLADAGSGWFDSGYLNDHSHVDGWSEPALGPDGTIYVSLNDPYLRAVDPNGTVKWVRRLGMMDGFTLTVGSDGLVYAAGYDGYLCVVDANGQEVARYQNEGCVTFPVISEDGTVIVSDANSNVLAIMYGDCDDNLLGLHRPEDLDRSGATNLMDFALLAADWLNCTGASGGLATGPINCDYEGDEMYFPGDVNRNLYVGFMDLGVLVERWLTED